LSARLTKEPRKPALRKTDRKRPGPGGDEVQPERKVEILGRKAKIGVDRAAESGMGKETGWKLEKCPVIGLGRRVRAPRLLPIVEKRRGGERKVEEGCFLSLSVSKRAEITHVASSGQDYGEL